MKNILLVITVLALLAGCKDYGKCLESHQGTTLMPVMGTNCSGKSCMSYVAAWVPIQTTFCDRYEFPDGKPEPKK